MLQTISGVAWISEKGHFDVARPNNFDERFKVGCLLSFPRLRLILPYPPAPPPTVHPHQGHHPRPQLLTGFWRISRPVRIEGGPSAPPWLRQCMQFNCNRRNQYGYLYIHYTVYSHRLCLWVNRMQCRSDAQEHHNEESFIWQEVIT